MSRPPAVLPATVILGAIALGATGPNVAQDDYPACRSALVAQVARQFAQNVTFIEWRVVFVREYPDWGESSALVYVAECPGYHYFVMQATAWRCSQPPGSEVVVRYRSSGGGC